MKRTAILLILILSLSLCACVSNMENEADSSESCGPASDTESYVADSTGVPESTDVPESETEQSANEDTTAVPETEDAVTTDLPETEEPKVTEAPAPPKTEEPETTEVSETEPIITDDPEEDDDYLQIPNSGGSSICEKLFATEDSERVLSFVIPTNWELEERDGRYIIKETNEIGCMFSGEISADDAWKAVDAANAKSGDLAIERYIEKSGVRDTLAFRYRYVYSFTEKGEERVLTLLLSYESVYDSQANRLMNEVELIRAESDSGLGILDKIGNGHLLILGNSFIKTSSVGGILGEMMQKNFKGCAVTAVWRSYARVGTYTADIKIMDDIKSGKYKAVFICGLYSEDELANLERLNTVCEASSTILVIFPAHNESREVIEAAKLRFPKLTVLDWKAEVDKLISAGVSRWDLCENDSHKHSTALAGYVGAHMIFRAIYGEVPTAYISTVLEQSLADKKLGDYTKTGVIKTIDPSLIINIGSSH